MTLSEMEQELKILKAQASAIEQILPTLATKADLALTTKALQLEIQTAMAEARRQAVILNEGTRDEIRAIAEGTALVSEKMATKSDLQELRRELRGEMAGLSNQIAADMQGLSQQIATLDARRRRKTR